MIRYNIIKRFLVFFIISLISLISCAGNPYTHQYYFDNNYNRLNLVIDDNFSIKEKELISSAWIKWENSLKIKLVDNTYYTLDIINIDEFKNSKFIYGNVVFLYKNHSITPNFGLTHHKLFTQKFFIDIYTNLLNDSSSTQEEHDKNMEATLLHEIGHVLGLGHNDTGYYTTVMKKYIDQDMQSPQCIDIINVCNNSNWGCVSDCLLLRDDFTIKTSNLISSCLTDDLM